MGYYGNRELLRRARVLRRNMSKAEIILWSRLRSKKIDGEIHSLSEKAGYDSKRDKLLKINGYHIIRLSNFEIETEIDSTINKIISYISEILSPSQGDHRGSTK